MSVRQGMLALLAEEPMHCYHLRQRFEERTGGTWPLNIGQAYTTVQRLVRDGLVEPLPADDDGPHAAAEDDAAADAPTTRTGARAAQHVERFRLTAAGHAEVASWWSTPVERGTPTRDELAIKIALAVTAPGVDVREIIQTQRTESLRALRDYTRLAAEHGPDLTWALVLDNLVFTTEAEVRWLDHVEARIARAAAAGTTTPASPGPAAVAAPGATAPPAAQAPPAGATSEPTSAASTTATTSGARR